MLKKASSFSGFGHLHMVWIYKYKEGEVKNFIFIVLVLSFDHMYNELLTMNRLSLPRSKWWSRKLSLYIYSVEVERGMKKLYELGLVYEHMVALDLNKVKGQKNQ